MGEYDRNSLHICIKLTRIIGMAGSDMNLFLYEPTTPFLTCPGKQQIVSIGFLTYNKAKQKLFSKSTYTECTYLVE